MLRSYLSDYSYAYIVVKGTITVKNRAIDGYNRNVILKNNASFIKCVSKINIVLIDNTEDLGIVMSIYNSTEYSQNYSKTSDILWNCKRDIIV